MSPQPLKDSDYCQAANTSAVRPQQLVGGTMQLSFVVYVVIGLPWTTTAGCTLSLSALHDGFHHSLIHCLQHPDCLLSPFIFLLALQVLGHMDFRVQCHEASQLQRLTALIKAP